MSPMIGAAILFAALWVAIIFSVFRLYRWLIRLDAAEQQGQAPFDRGL